MVYNPPYTGTSRRDLETYIAARLNSPSSYFTGTQLGQVNLTRDLYNQPSSSTTLQGFSTCCPRLWNDIMETMGLEPHLEMYIPYSQQNNPAYMAQNLDHETWPNVQDPSQKGRGRRSRVPETTQRWIRREIESTVQREKRQKKEVAAFKAAASKTGVPAHRFRPSSSSSVSAQASPSQNTRAAPAFSPSNPPFTGHAECELMEHMIARIRKPHDFFPGAQLERVLAALKRLTIEPGTIKPRDAIVAQDKNKWHDLVEAFCLDWEKTDLPERLAQETLAWEKREQTPELEPSGSERINTESPTQDSHGAWSDDIWQDDVLPVPPRTPNENPPFTGTHSVDLTKYILARLTDPFSYYSHPQVDAVCSRMMDYPTVAIDIYSDAARNYLRLVPKVFERFLLVTHLDGEVILEAIKDVGCPHRRVDMRQWNKIIEAMGLEPHAEEPFVLERWTRRGRASRCESVSPEQEDSDSDKMDTDTKSSSQNANDSFDEFWSLLPPPRTPEENPPFTGSTPAEPTKYILPRLMFPGRYSTSPRYQAVTAALYDYPSVAVDLYCEAVKEYSRVPKAFEWFLENEHDPNLVKSVKKGDIGDRRVNMRAWNKIGEAMGLQRQERPFVLERWIGPKAEREVREVREANHKSRDIVIRCECNERCDTVTEASEDNVGGEGEDVKTSRGSSSTDPKHAKTKRASSRKPPTAISNQPPNPPCTDSKCECRSTHLDKGKGKEVQAQPGEPQVSSERESIKTGFLNQPWIAKVLQIHPNITAPDMIAIIESQMDLANIDRGQYSTHLMLKKYAEIHLEITAADMFAVMDAAYN